MFGLQEYQRVIGAAQILYLAGRTLKRQGVKYTVAAAFIAAAAMFADTIGDKVDSSLLDNRWNAFFLPAAVALMTFGLGNILIALSNLFSAEKILFADANAMNLMEDRKKADMEHHLRHLWDRVFKYVAELQSQANNSEPSPYRRENDTQFPSTREEFIEAAGHSLRHHLPQKLEKSMTGCNLALVEDWYDGAFFTLNDCKLKEQFAAHQAIRGIRKIVGLSIWVRLREALTGYPDPIWFNLTLKKIGSQVGKLIDQMNKKHVKPTEPKYFDAQDFLWNHPEADQLIGRHFPQNQDQVLADLFQVRKNMMRSIFSANPSQGHRQIFRMFGRDFLNALKLRLDYDIEFAARLLDYSPLDDIEEMNRLALGLIYPEVKVQQKMKTAENNITILEQFLAEHLPEIRAWPFTLRAARIGFHINHCGIQRLVGQDPVQAGEVFKTNILPGQNRFSQRICLLRQHYELSRIQIFSYTQMVDELADYPQPDLEQENS